MQARAGCQLKVGLLRSSWLLVIVAAACSASADSGTKSVISSARSPDSSWSAALVRRIPPGALNNDIYYVILTTGKLPSDTSALFTQMDDSAVLMATRAERLQLQWQGGRELHVICARCGLEPIDVIRKRDHHGPVTVVFDGFP